MATNSIEIIKRLANDKNSQIEFFHFVTFKECKILQERISGKEILHPITDALSLREKYGLPFWDGFNLSLYNKVFSDFSFLNQIRFHNPKEQIYKVHVSDLQTFLNSWDMENYLTINSKIILKDGRTSNLVLLDFHIPVSVDNQNICENVIKTLKLNGNLLVSGKSYHFFGKHLVDDAVAISNLSLALLFCPILDRTWIAHQLIENSCCLRISKKYGHYPFSVCVI